jgi:hypothetical protein
MACAAQSQKRCRFSAVLSMNYDYPLKDERKTQSRAFLYIIEAYEWNSFMSRLGLNCW